MSYCEITTSIKRRRSSLPPLIKTESAGDTITNGKKPISYRDALIIGLAQACAAMPGLSRSGSTIATGLLLGNKKAAVAQFSFLMVLAPILGETLLQATSGDLTAGIAAGPLIAGFLASFITGCLACKFMIEVVKRGKLIWFAVYCTVAGLVSITSYFC